MPAKADKPEPLQINLGTAKIDLEMVCPTCRGVGHTLVDNGKTIVGCPKCQGTGIVLSNQGYAILMLFKKYGAQYLR
jgi:DnaJ-class molecular chaperone